MSVWNKNFAIALLAFGCAATLQPRAVSAETLTTGVDATFAPMAMQKLVSCLINSDLYN